LLLMGLASFSLVLSFTSFLFRPSVSSPSIDASRSATETPAGGGRCCQGIENTELWGDAVKWGSEFKLNSPEECCEACKGMCPDRGGACRCNTWVFCGNKANCGDKFGECWLKHQKDSLASGSPGNGGGMWTSGQIFGQGEGIVALETEYGTLRIKLLPECSPRSVAYILELLSQRHCAGCHFYRAEGRGKSWDDDGNHINSASLGPPFGLIQGTFESDGEPLAGIRSEHCPGVSRGSVAWVGSGPEFFISLANHPEWNKAYTVFGTVVPEDMAVAEGLAEMPTKEEVWNKIHVRVLEKIVPLKIKR
ncbi:hypothetical protein M569_16066, partial [Genlisea aurea]